MLMDSAVVIEFSKLIHLLGLAMGLGGAIFADLLGLRLLLFPERRSLVAIIDRLHRAIGWGLGIVWVSGVALIVLRFSFDEIPNKVFVKYVLVSVITINAIFIGRVVLPFVRTAAAPLAHTLGARHILVLALASSVSIVGWMATLLVAKISALQQMPIFALLGDIALAWVACLAIILAFIVVARALPPAPEKQHRPRTGAEPSVAADIASRPRPADRMHAGRWPLAGLLSGIRKSRQQARSVREREEAEFQAQIDRIEKDRSGRATERAASPDPARAK